MIKEKVKEKIDGQTRFEDNYSNCSPATVQECLLVFLNNHRLIRKRTEDTVVALHPESIQGIEIS